MAPNITSAPTGVLFEDDTLEDSNIPPVESFSGNAGKKYESKPYKVQIVWRNVILFVYLHAAALYGAYLMFTSAKILTSIWGEFSRIKKLCIYIYLK